MGSLILLLKQPGIVLLLLQYLHHGFLQATAILLEHEVLNDERDLVGKTLAGPLEEGIRRVSGGGLGSRPVVAARSLGVLGACVVAVLRLGGPVHPTPVFRTKAGEASVWAPSFITEVLRTHLVG